MALRESLANRRRPTATFPLRIKDDNAARAALATALESGDAREIESAKAALEACYETLSMTALPPNDWEDLVAEHPPTDQQRTAGAWCDMDTFTFALMAACIEGDESPDDWSDFVTKGCLNHGEAVRLTETVFTLNQRSPEPWYPKDSTTTRN